MRHFKVMFLDGHYASMYDRKGERRDTDIGGVNHRRWQLRQRCVDHVDLRGMLDLPLLCHAEENSYVRCHFA